MLNLFGHTALPKNEINQQVLPYSFGHYDELAKAFSSANGFNSHMSNAEYQKMFANQRIGITNEQSWTDAGAREVVKREEKMAAITIQRFFRANKAKQSDSRKEALSVETDAVSKKDF